MGWRRQLAVAALIVVLVLGVYLALFPPLWLVSPGEYETTTVTAVDANGTTLATVTVRIADTPEKQRVGLSRTTDLEPDEGMLFIFDAVAERSFYMPDSMSFPLDMVFVDGNGTITQIHHAPLPANAPAGADYVGRAQYVLEVTMGWANRTGIGIGDTLQIPESVG